MHSVKGKVEDAAAVVKEKADIFKAKAEEKVYAHVIVCFLIFCCGNQSILWYVFLDFLEFCRQRKLWQQQKKEK